MRVLFITGTSTGVGKTLASALLCRELMQRQYKVAYIKPIQTGCIEKNGQLLAPDVEFVKSICGDAIDYYCPYTLQLPASPHLAAQQEGVSLKSLTIANTLTKFGESGSFDFVITEGAGGLAVPINEDLDMAGLCKIINGELVIVTTTKLGTLNHTKLTVEYAKSHGLECSAIINGCHEKPDIIESDNKKLIAAMLHHKILFKIPYINGLDTEKLTAVNLPEVQLHQSLLV